MKRFFDLFISAAALLVLSPLFLVASLAVLLDDGAPIIYRQERVGRGNKIFTIYKFRTMKNGTRIAATNDLAQAGECTTRVGAFLRRTSIDELPQLVNIVNGDMSLVGPRPLIAQETEIRALRESYGVYSVRPGLTGLAQINGRDCVGIEEKAALDRRYVSERTLSLDARILFKTVGLVLRGEGVADGGASVPAEAESESAERASVDG